MNKKSICYKLLTVLLCTTILSSCSSKAAVVDTTVTDGISKVVTYEANDYYTDWKNETPNYIALTGTSATLKGTGAAVEGSNINITAAGVYVISGKLDNGQIIVNVKDKGIVKLVLNGAEINCSNNAPICVVSAGKTIISLQEGTENILNDGEKYVFADASTDEPNAAIYSKDDLTINGTGKLTVHGNYNDGITSKDVLKVTGGNLQIYSADDGLMGKDLVAVKAGTISIEAGGDGIKASNDKDTLKGSIAIEGGTFNIKSEVDGINANTSAIISGGEFNISAGDDGIHADETLIITDGKVNIAKSYEGLESNIITLSGGEIHVTSSDDGINAAEGATDTADTTATKSDKMQSTGKSMLNINGGYITVDASGDGLDANGSIKMTSGTVIVSGSTNNGNASIDYDGKFEISGGLLIAAGSSGMAQATSEESSQYSIIMTYIQTQKDGATTHLQDSKGNTVATFTPKKDYQSVVVSSPKVVKGETYTLYSGGTATTSESVESYTASEYKSGTKIVEFTIKDSVTWINETGVTTAKSSGSGGQGNPGERAGQRDLTAMKTAYGAILKALVVDKTITQEQSDKILVAVTGNMQAGSSGVRPDDKAPVDGVKPDATMDAGGGKPKNDRLSELVTGKVITQAQADTINQKFQESMGVK